MNRASALGKLVLQQSLPQTDKKENELIQQEGQVVQSTPDGNSSFYVDCQIWPTSCAIGMMERGRDGEADTLTGVHVGLYNNYSSHKLIGLEAAIVNDNQSSVQGMQLGVYNRAKDIEGSQLALIANDNDACEDVSAYSAAFLYNANDCKSSLGSTQLSIVYNTAEDIVGVQASFANLAKEATGVQIGIVTVASDFTGVQAGFVTFANYFRGASIGLVTVTGRMMNGLRVAIANIGNGNKPTKECHGVQVGIHNSESPHVFLGVCYRD
jgi:hypothetical protein